ncbi:filamentous hemagglutinin family protein [Achromobacter seleniivolatilans]|uniref:Filamentous hemagglutinin family protein n=1 Tax=Achromobacter seleniivolatilans TaxID=3047478 RepID=A0ABY9LVG7_9BURK|nr:filamentous haemagglutinin family protein [Achromobacter sp. R39]WMD18154.1 filamentous hemagglutinin family protein [Achromobacter sp. R39]
MSSSTSATSPALPSSRQRAAPLRFSRRGHRPAWRLSPLSQAVAALAIAGSASGPAQAQARAFSPGWFSDKNAVQSTAQRTGRMPDGSLAGIGQSARQQAQSRQQLQKSLDNLNRTAAAVAAQQAAQAAARAAAAAGGNDVPDGRVEGGLWEAQGALAKWEGASAAVAASQNGKHTVTIEQTQSRAILNWDTFNVGRNTTVQFKQAASDAVLNRVVGASAKPSQIQGAIKADGTVLVVNQNGVIFTGSSQVNTRNLVVAAATITDAQFRDKGLFVDTDGTQATFKDALGQVQVQAGARIDTAVPATATKGGGYVLLLGSEAHNAGAITTPRGQTVLAAGDDFVIRRGYGTDGNPKSTTTGNEVSALRKSGSQAGLVRNTGLISAPTGDITLTGHDVRQDGVLVATTDIGTRGAIHLLNRASDATGSVTLGAGSVTAVVLEASAVTGLDSQRDAAIKALDGTATNKASGNFDHLSTVADRQDLSRIEVVTGNLATFQGGSTTVATGGQIVVSAKKQTVLESGAELDVAGAIGVRVSMESNNLQINVQGNEQRDAPINRDSKLLNNSDVWVDRRTLVKVASGTNGYRGDRWYTSGGLLEVGGYLVNDGRGAGQWLAQGGSATFTGGELVTRAGSGINLSGGTLDVQDGIIRQSWLRGADGRLYEVSRAPGDLLYTGLYKGYEQTHERWGEKATRTFYNPLIAPRERFESGYTVGRDAGQLIVSTAAAQLAGTLTGEVYQGGRQVDAPQWDADGYYQSQTAVARRAQLVVGRYTPIFDATTNMLAWTLTGVAGQVTAGTGEAGAGEIRLDAAWLNAAGLGGIRLAGTEHVAINEALSLTSGAGVVLYAPQVDINAGISAAGGKILAGNILKQWNANGRNEDTAVSAPTGKPTGVTLGAGAVLDASGLWTNLSTEPQSSAGLAYRNGGSVALRSTNTVAMAADSTVDVSGGAAMLATGKTRNGKGGDVTLAAGVNAEGGVLTLDGAIAGQGVDGGGKLTLQAANVRIVAADQTAAIAAAARAGGQDVSILSDGAFGLGFSQYEVIGFHGLEVADGAQMRVTMPVQRYAPSARAAQDKAQALQIWMPPLYQEDPVKSALTQRKGASLALQAGTALANVAALDTTPLRIGVGALIEVDPGQKIDLTGIGQITVNGTLNAWGGAIAVRALRTGLSDDAIAAGHGRSIWLGERAVLDVAGRATTAINHQGQTYGRVQDGGAIMLGSQLDDALGVVVAPDLFVVLRPGSRLDASGSAATVLSNGAPAYLAGAGGNIAISSGNGLYLDGQMNARAGGAGAAGGTLSIALDAPAYRIAALGARANRSRDLFISQQTLADALASFTGADGAADALVYGHGALSVEQVESGGFGSLSLLSNGAISFAGDVSLRMNQSLRLFSGSINMMETAASNSRVLLAAPYVMLAGATDNGAKDGYTRPSHARPPSTRVSESVLTTEAGFIDLRDSVLLGELTVKHAPDGAVSYIGMGFAQTDLRSQGDIRLLGGRGTQVSLSNQPFTTQLSVPGNLSLTAAQIYPDTGAVTRIVAGLGGKRDGILGYEEGSTITIRRSTDTLPPMPYTAFGSLRLGADIIEQGGVLRAPLGLLEVGVSDTTGTTSRATLLPGSVTSVSGRGLVMPYGGTVDGVSYQYAGENAALTGMGAATITGELRAGLQLAGEEVRVSQDATLDLSGGGQLLGAGFVTGRGGSTDARFSPLVQINAKGQGFTLPGLSTNPVYALVPGVQTTVAPIAADARQNSPQIGQQVTIGSGVPGLPVGTYTLMPSTYALMPGAFRVEINGAATGAAANGAMQLRNGSWALAGRMGVAGTGIGSAVPKQLLITPAAVLRQMSQYNEMDYAAFVQADAARRGLPRAMLPADARTLRLKLNPGPEGQAFAYAGRADFSAAAGGYGGTFAVTSTNSGTGHTEITAPGAGRSAGFDGLSLDSAQMSAVGAPRLVLGALPNVDYYSNANTVDFGYAGTHFNSLVLRDGATLSAAEVFMVTSGLTTGITIESGAVINTIGRGKSPFDSTAGFNYGASASSFLALSNGWINMLPPTADQEPNGAGPIRIGVCATACSGESLLYTEGTLAAVTNKVFDLGTNVSYGARYLNLSVGTVNAGGEQALAEAAARGALADGLALNQTLLNRLMAGDRRFGAPALEMLTLAVSDSFNFFGNVTLDTIDAATGKSRLQTLALTAPAIYGYGQAGDVATLRAGNLIWNGSITPPAGVIDHGAGTGSGTLDIQAERIEFGYGPYTQPLGQNDNGRLALGFSEVNLTASDRITANHRGALEVYQSRGAFDAVKGWQYSGGTLNLNTPLLTGEAGSVNRLKAGAAININGPAAAPVNANANGLGAELSLDAGTLNINGRIAVPTGKLSLSADNALILGANAQLDVAGRPVPFHDITKYSWGGDINLESRHGDITQAAGSTIDLSAQNNRAGRLTAVALDDNAGRVDLQGRILGAASGTYDAGGTQVPYAFGEVDIRAQLVDFAGLNQRLNDGQVFGGRSFQIKRGSLVVGDEVRARFVNLSVDAGSLTVAGRIDASGAGVGSIRLAARDGLRLASSAVLDTHGTTLRVDSYGKIIDAPNRAIVELNSGQGLLQLDAGAIIDLRAGTAALNHDGLPRGTLDLNAPRLGGISGGDINIDARGPLDIRGARSIAVNGVWIYTDATAGTETTADGKPYQVIDQAYLKRLHDESTDFIDNARANGNLINTKLAGLRAYGDALHLRPGVEIRSATPDGNLVVQGDLDLSGFRYASINPHTPLRPGVLGSGEVGNLVIRAGGDLQIHGSINDGFAPPPVVTQDLNGWRLLPGLDFTGADLITPHAGVVLTAGTAFPGGVALNYDVALQGGTLSENVVLPVTAPLARELVLPAGTVLSAPILNPDGSVAHAAGTVLRQALTLPAGMQLGAGTRLLTKTFIGAVTWPAGIPLPNNANPENGNVFNEVKLASEVTLPRGALIPAGTKVQLRAGVEYIDLRPVVDGAQGQVWAVAPMLPEGSQSWSMRLAGGADLNAADTRATQFTTKDGVKRGDVVLADNHYGMYGFDGPRPFIWTQMVGDVIGMPELIGQPVDDDFVRDNFGYADAVALCNDNPEFCTPTGDRTFVARPGTARFSVLRTGTGDLDLLAAGDLRMQSLYGVYTAGTSSAGTYAGDPYNQPRLINADGTVLRDPSKGFEAFVDGSAQSVYRAWYPDGGGNVTLRAGVSLTGDLLKASQGSVGRPQVRSTGYNSDQVGNWLWRQGTGDAAIGQAQPTAWWLNFGTYTSSAASLADELVGFTGFGALGGGNLDIDVRGDAGIITARPISYMERYINPHSQGLVLAVGSTGRVMADGTLALTGGGDISLRVGGSLNPTLPSPFESTGAITNLRGQTLLQAASVGRLDPLYNVLAARDTRALDRFQPSSFDATGGLTLTPGDSAFQLQSLGDLVALNARDPGRVFLPAAMPYTQADGTLGVHGSSSWFSLWTPHTAIDLFSAGGNLSPAGAASIDSDGVNIYPSQFSAVAAHGSIQYIRDVALAPGALARLDLLAGDSIFGSDSTFGRTSASTSALASIFRPAFVGMVQAPTSNAIIWGPNTLSPDGTYQSLALFTFESMSASTSGVVAPSRIYARDGDLVGVSSGRLIQPTSNGGTPTGTNWYVAGGPVRMMAGRDIVGSGSPLGIKNGLSGPYPHDYSNNYFVHGDATDVSVVQAGRDILYSNFTVAGPGTLEVSAGRNILMEDKAAVVSLGPVVPGDTRPGASIVLQAGLGAAGADYAGFLRRYLDAGNLADPSLPLTDQGKPFKTYETELLLWLTQRYAFAGNTDDARAFFNALAPEQQRVFARQIYFAELRAGGREYNDKTSPRDGSYLRGRQAIAALFPINNIEGQAQTYKGSVTMYGGAGLQTRSGGDVQVLTPGGAQVYGVEGAAPPGSAGVLTQGQGNIQLYAQDSILLGQSRVMTTFGGDILAWSAQGDINAGRGSKTTVVYTPPRRVYDSVGNITLSPAAPSSGAGIATLAPLAEVPAGDVDLYAPLGTIDAGEAGIRVSGNVYIGAQTVLNAANIKSEGDSIGVPVAASVNTGALTSASAAASSAVNAAQDSAQRAQNQARQNQPSIINVQILGFGAEPVSGTPSPQGKDGQANNGAAYRPNNMVQVVGDGALTPAQLAKLSSEEKQAFGL